MKKIYIIVTIIFICALTFESHASVQKRYQWWKFRLKSNEKKEILLSKNKKIDNRVLELLRDEKGRTKKIISIFEGIINNHGQTFSGKKILSKEVFNTKLNESLKQIFSLFYSNELLNNIGKNNINLKKKIRKKINALILNRFKNRNNNLTNKIMDEDVTACGLKNIILEQIIISYMQNREKIINNLKKEIQSNIKSNKNRKEIYLSAYQLHKLIYDSVKASFENNKYNSINDLAKFEKTWRWENIKFNLEKELEGYKKIISFNKDFKKLPLIAIRDIYNNRPKSPRILKNKRTLYSTKYMIKGIDIINQFKNQIERNNIYINFLHELLKASTNIPYYNFTNNKIKLIGSLNKLKKVFKFMESSLSINRKNYILLNKNEKKAVKKHTLKMKQTLITTNQLIKNHYRQFIYRNTLISRNTNKFIQSFKNKFIQYEIDILTENLGAYSRLFRKYNYDKKILTEYQDIYNDIYAQCKSGIITKSINKLLENKSILPLITNFNKKRLQSERESKNYLRKEGHAAFARLVTLIRYYKKKKIKIKIYPRTEENNIFRKTFTKRFKTKISNWNMDETNYQIIDKNAVKKLSLILNKRIWESRIKKNKNAHKKIRIKEMNISLIIPEGWAERDLNFKDKYLGISKSFYSLDRDSTIYFARISLKNNNIKNISEKWIKHSNFSPVKKSWGFKNKNEYFHTLSKDNNKNIFETFVISKNGFAYVIAGKVSKSKYGFFRNKLKSIFNSIEFNI